MSHARLSPSSASRWTKCPGSVNRIIELNKPDKSSMPAEEGTAAHELLEVSLLDDLEPVTYKGRIFNKCEIAPEGFEVDDDMIEAVSVAFNFCRELKLKRNVVLLAEEKINPGGMFNRDDCTGTADITVLYDEVIGIYDYKHGKGVVVEVDGNLQLILYALGVLAKLTPDQRRGISYVKTGIIQPRCMHKDGPIRTVRYDVSTLYEWATWFITKAKATDDPDAALVAGKSQCQWCPMKPTCPALVSKTMTTFEIKTMSDLPVKVLRDPKELTEAERRLILDNAEIIESFIKSVKALAQSDLKDGHPVPGFKLIRGKQGNRKWNQDEDKVVKKLMSSFGLKKSQVTGNPKLIGIEKILNLAKKSEKCTEGKLKNLQVMIDRPEGKAVLVPESHPSESILSQQIEDAFKDVPKLMEKSNVKHA